MKEKQIESLRNLSRKLVRELGMLQLSQSNSKTTPGHWHALIEISKEPGITISKLGHLLLISNSTVSRLVKSLAKHGLLELKAGYDKREKYLHLTSQGVEEVKKIDAFSKEKIIGAFEILTELEVKQVIESIDKYSEALEKSRMMREHVKIATISTSRVIRKQIINMVADIQKNEFEIPVSDEDNICILKAEEDFYYNNSYNFWYATDHNGKIVGSMGLKKLDDEYAEIKKVFVLKEYRGKGIAQRLMSTLLKAASKHGFKYLVLGMTQKLRGAQKFYNQYGFTEITKGMLHGKFVPSRFDTVFLRSKVER